jgi:hypothetical protein
MESTALASRSSPPMVGRVTASCAAPISSSASLGGLAVYLTSTVTESLVVATELIALRV